MCIYKHSILYCNMMSYIQIDLQSGHILTIFSTFYTNNGY